ncbi:PhnE/PtxC family ABC transporter permease [Microbacterium paludicola]|uniref:ABC transporter permease subunit n=1 Tax=Microbacterium paludicola TaxID=300019 RepID=A0A4Y9FVV1_9MICO|nr:ABC transporter permease subunit [Microbacterium paludicola]MBF0816319.1 ABC transporter permease subunit [Microbacterium paludicola]TFU32984.1 ABC transporter permease subunit [Microbacterium paludicola]
MTAPAVQVGLADRITAVPRPAPRLSTVVSYAVIIGVLGLGVWSFIALDYNLANFGTTGDNIARFLNSATPMQWPGFEVMATVGAGGAKVFTIEWVGWEPVGHMIEAIAITLAITIAATFLSALLSIPVAYGAAQNTTPGPTVMAICRGIGVLARAVPDIVFVVFFAFLWFNSGTLPAIVAVALHSVGMISKMFADAIEQIDEGPRLAVRSAGGSKIQEFWTGVVPQALPAWIAVTLHRADINLRGTVILGVVGVVGLGYDLDEALHAGPSGLRRVIPLVLVIIVLCLAFEIISSLVRARLLGVEPTGKRLGDVVARAASKNKAAAPALAAVAAERDPDKRIANALKRPWDRRRLASTIWIWVGIAVVVASFLYCAPNVAKIFAPEWDQVNNPALDRALWPPTIGDRTWAVVLDAVLTTLKVAFTATLIAAVISAFVGPLSARNVAPARWVRSLFRGITIFLRAVPELVVAILFIIATGFGAQAAALALGVGGVGLLGKLIGDSMEEVPNGPERALSAAGGTRPQVFFSSTVPLSVPALVSHLMYVLDHNIRSATLLGVVGAGGIGFLLLNALQGRHFDQVNAFLFVIIAMVVVVEGASVLIRRALK